MFTFVSVGLCVWSLMRRPGGNQEVLRLRSVLPTAPFIFCDDLIRCTLLSLTLHCLWGKKSSSPTLLDSCSYSRRHVTRIWAKFGLNLARLAPSGSLPLLKNVFCYSTSQGTFQRLQFAVNTFISNQRTEIESTSNRFNV